jgi:hypothetical protein
MLAHVRKQACGEAQGGRENPKDEDEEVSLHEYVNPELD